jgi:hypothetical protein
MQAEESETKWSRTGFGPVESEVTAGATKENKRPSVSHNIESKKYTVVFSEIIYYNIF